MEIDLQLNPATSTWPQLRDAAVAADEGGYGALWMVDHLAGRSMGGDSMLECFTALGAFAAITERIHLGTLVANVHNRRPGVLAVAAASLQRISGRPILLGLGAGASPVSPYAAEQHDVGHEVLPTMAERHQRVAEVLDLLDVMWRSGDERFDDFPRPSPFPSVLLGVNSAALARLAAARTDGINVRWSDPSARELIDVARQARSGDDPLLVTVWAKWDAALADPDHPVRKQLAEAAVDRLILLALEPVAAGEIRSVGEMLAPS